MSLFSNKLTKEGLSKKTMKICNNGLQFLGQEWEYYPLNEGERGKRMEREVAVGNTTDNTSSPCPNPKSPSPNPTPRTKPQEQIPKPETLNEPQEPKI